MGRLSAFILGAAAGGGFPQWNCNCDVCRLAWAGDPRVKPRTQTSIAVTSRPNGPSSFADAPFVLINASPDLRQQIIATPALQPRGLRMSPIAAVVLTGGEVDQTAGLLTLRERGPVRLFGTPSTVLTLAANTIFSLLAADVVPRPAIPARAGAKTGRRMGHMPVGGPDGTLAALAGLARRRILIHINNTNPILIEGSPQRRAVEAAGFEVAEDGMRIEL